MMGNELEKKKVNYFFLGGGGGTKGSLSYKTIYTVGVNKVWVD